MYRNYGFLAPRSESASTADEAADKASSIGFPVVMKVASPDILHKTDVGGVELNLRSEPEVRAAFARMMASVKKSAPAARVHGVTVEETVREGVEIIIGLNNDAQFGPTIMFGLGGVLTEILHDVSFRVLPITRADAEAMIDEIKGKAILDGYRGQPPVSREMLANLLLNAARMGMVLADRLESVDFNPIVVWGGEHRVLDAKILLQPDAKSVVLEEPDTSHLNLFFNAKSVAVIGASATPGKIGNAVLDSLALHDYRGKIFPVNPTREELMGLKAYPTLSAIPEPVDLVVVTVVLSMVPDLIRECAAKGTHAMVIISGGGKELGGDSEVLEAEIARLARKHDVRIVGCNCIGVFDGKTRLDTFFQVYERMVRPSLGGVSILTQSGTVGAALLEAIYDLGISKFVSYGNRIDVDEADLLAYLAQDNDTKVVACYIEGLKRGRKFLATASRVAQSKPIVVFKPGRTLRSARASISHTGFFGGDYSVWRGAFRQAGIIAVDSFEDLYAVTKALAMQPRANGNRVAMISNGAGTMVQGIDLLPEYGLEMKDLSTATVAALRQAYPPFYVVQNPVDVTGSATTSDYVVGIEALLKDPNVDIVMPWFVFQDTPVGEDIAEGLGELRRSYDKPILVGGTGGPFTARMSQDVEAQGVPVYASVRQWIAAAMGLAHRPGAVWRAR
jgi:3-hydroxypropionyl-CoA synthetase (ADP-forming)